MLSDPHNHIAHHGSIRSQLGDELSNDLPDQARPRVVFIDVGRSGIAAPFLFRSFLHDTEIADA